MARLLTDEEIHELTKETIDPTDDISRPWLLYRCQVISKTQDAKTRYATLIEVGDWMQRIGRWNMGQFIVTVPLEDQDALLRGEMPK